MEPQNSPLQFYRKIQPQIAAIVLAGGQSSRMGRDKALIEVGGVPLLHKICAAAQSCANPVYVIAPWVERYQSILPPGCQLLPEVPLPGRTSYQFKKRRRQMNLHNPDLEGDFPAKIKTIYLAESADYCEGLVLYLR
jgi:hypothetical protein